MGPGRCESAPSPLAGRAARQYGFVQPPRDPMLLLAACAAPSTDPPDTADTGASACWDDLSPGTVVPVATGLDGGTEGLTFVDDRLFVSVSDGVLEVLADGTTTRLATTTSALGLAPWAGGLAVAAPGDFTLDGSGDDGEVLQVGLDGAVTSLLQGLPNPNFVTPTPWGTLLVSDDTNETLWTLDGAVWLDGIPSPNGMGFSPDGGTLYVATTFATDPPVWAVPVDGGVAGTPVELARLPTGSTPDGLTVGPDGTVYVAANLLGEIVAVTPDREATTAAAGLDTPASLAFGAAGWDPCSLYVTSLVGTEVVRVALGAAG